jgi:hypothetical protein
MKLAVTDANIFIDLIKLQIVALLFEIEIEIHTCQEIIEQLREDQQHELSAFIKSGQLKVYFLAETDLEEVVTSPAPRSLEFADRSVTWLAVRLNAIVLSGDGPLRRFCESKKLDVRGIIWLFDTFLEKKLLNHQDAIEKMNRLLTFNSRLPRAECEKRKKDWIRHV